VGDEVFSTLHTSPLASRDGPERRSTALQVVCPAAEVAAQQLTPSVAFETHIIIFVGLLLLTSRAKPITSRHRAKGRVKTESVILRLTRVTQK